MLTLESPNRSDVGLDVIFDKIAGTTSINIEDYVPKASICVSVTDIKGVDSPGIFIPAKNDAKQQFSPEDMLTSYPSRPYFAAIVCVFQWYIRYFFLLSQLLVLLSVSKKQPKT
jgi:hypothetical protein